ncbi:MAG: hypothetical protein JWM11_5912 [Planctomycetaceae bacterium]|nr:hypothetical protein [Planctomycetaceae bacterium]
MDAIPVDARRLSEVERQRIHLEVASPRVLKTGNGISPVGWKIEPKPGLFERRILGPVFACQLLLRQAIAAVLFVLILAWGRLVSCLVQVPSVFKTEFQFLVVLSAVAAHLRR